MIRILFFRIVNTIKSLLSENVWLNILYRFSLTEFFSSLLINLDSVINDSSHSAGLTRCFSQLLLMFHSSQSKPVIFEKSNRLWLSMYMIIIYRRGCVKNAEKSLVQSLDTDFLKYKISVMRYFLIPAVHVRAKSD